MNNKLITAVAFKFFGIYLLISSIQSLPLVLFNMTTFDSFNTDPEYSNTFSLFIISLITIIIGIVLCKLLWILSEKVINDFASDETELKLDSLQITLLQIMGLYFSVASIEMLIDSVFQISSYSMFGSVWDDWDNFKIHLFNFLPSIVILIIGIHFIFKTSFWVEVLRKSRNKKN